MSAWLVFAGSPGGDQATSTQEPLSLRRAWPGAVITDAPGVLADGAVYVPALYTDAATSIGVAPTPDGTEQRVLIRAGDRVRELTRVRQDRFPRFAGFTESGGTVFWAESTATAIQPLSHRLLRAPVAGDTAATLLTDDTGDAVLLGAQYDLVVHDDRLSWAAANTNGVDTEVRSVPVAGGPVTVMPVDGAYELSAWPWLQTATNVRQGGGRQELRNLVTGQRTAIVRSAAETVDCGPVWCRSVVSAGSGGDSHVDVLRVDGTGRRRVGEANSAPAVPAVALLDRFVVMVQTGTRSAFDAAQRLLMYDLAAGRLVALADNVDQVGGAGHLLWWSTGSRQAGTWHVLDLAALRP